MWSKADTLADPGFSFGCQVEHRRREYRGCRGVIWGGGVPLNMGRGTAIPIPLWEGYGEELCPSPEIYWIFCLGMVHFAYILTHD